jgi:hypothetical protein
MMAKNNSGKVIALMIFISFTTLGLMFWVKGTKSIPESEKWRAVFPGVVHQMNKNFGIANRSQQTIEEINALISDRWPGLNMEVHSASARPGYFQFDVGQQYRFGRVHLLIKGEMLQVGILRFSGKLFPISQTFEQQGKRFHAYQSNALGKVRPVENVSGKNPINILGIDWNESFKIIAMTSSMSSLDSGQLFWQVLGSKLAASTLKGDGSRIDEAKL